MSVQAISWVLEHSPAKGTDRLVLIALANHAGTSPVNGAWESWPGVRTIAREARLDRLRTVTDALSRLVADGMVERVVNGAPDYRCRADRRPNLYRIVTTPGKADAEPEGDASDERTADGAGCRESSPRGPASRADAHPGGVSDGDTPPGERGVAGASNGVSDGDTQTVIEPGLTNSSLTSPRRGERQEEDESDRRHPVEPIHQALWLLAKRDLEARNQRRPADAVAGRRRRRAWLRTGYAERLEASGPKLAALHEANPDATPERLVDLLAASQAENVITLDDRRRPDPRESQQAADRRRREEDDRRRREAEAEAQALAEERGDPAEMSAAAWAALGPKAQAKAPRRRGKAG